MPVPHVSPGYRVGPLPVDINRCSEGDCCNIEQLGGTFSTSTKAVGDGECRIGRGA